MYMSSANTEAIVLSHSKPSLDAKHQHLPWSQGTIEMIAEDSGHNGAAAKSARSYAYAKERKKSIFFRRVYVKTRAASSSSFPDSWHFFQIFKTQ